MSATHSLLPLVRVVNNTRRSLGQIMGTGMSRYGTTGYNHGVLSEILAT